MCFLFFFFFFQAEDGIRDLTVTGVQTCALPILRADDDQVGMRFRGDGVDLLPRDAIAQDRDHLHPGGLVRDRKSTRLNSSHSQISYAVFCLKKKKKNIVSSDRTCMRLSVVTSCV